MNDEQIKHMVNRFLAWRLPTNFNPDAGISFTPKFNVGTPYEMSHNPTGTNLLDYTQAEAMVRHMVEGMPISSASAGEAYGLMRSTSTRPVAKRRGTPKHPGITHRSTPMTSEVEALRERVRAEMIKAINHALRRDPGPTRTAHRTAAAEYAAILSALKSTEGR